jgi:hypothetical protein
VLALLLFWNAWVLWPVKVTVVVFHELSHAMAAVLTGGEVVSISLSPNEGGLTQTIGGRPLVILNAGYLGSLAWGIGLVLASKRANTARMAVVGLAILLAGTTLFYVRPIVSFGFVFAGLVAGAMAALSRWGGGEASSLVLRGLGTFSILYALVDVWSDVLRPLGTGLSDASLLAAATGVPGVVWGLMWLGIGCGTLWALRRSLA